MGLRCQSPKKSKIFKIKTKYIKACTNYSSKQQKEQWINMDKVMFCMLYNKKTKFIEQYRCVS